MDSESLKMNAAFFPKPYKLTWQLDMSLRETSTTAHVWEIFVPVSVFDTRKDPQRPSHCEPGKSVRWLLPALTLSENASSLTSRNLPNWLPSKLRNGLKICPNRSALFFFCFHRIASYKIPGCWCGQGLTLGATCITASWSESQLFSGLSGWFTVTQSNQLLRH